MTQQLRTPSRRYTVEEFLRLDRDADSKHELRDGEILAMAGSTPEHSLIIANTIGELRHRLKGTPCRVYDSNLRVRVARTVRYSYPDASVICGEAQLDPLDANGTTVINPCAVIEVLSDSTELSDRGEKFQRYLQLESLQEYVLISQATARIETFFRQPDGTWSFATTSGLNVSVRLRSLGVDLLMGEIYSGVTFPPQVDEAGLSSE